MELREQFWLCDEDGLFKLGDAAISEDEECPWILEVAPDGRLLRLDVVEEEGHEALTESTLTAFRAFAPYHPLPNGFPEPTLKLRVKVIYPDWR